MAAIIEYNADIDLGQGQLIRALLENLASHPTSPKTGRIYWNTIDEGVMVYNGVDWVNLGEQYSHPTYAALNPALGTNNVLASIQVNSEGHVIGASTRVLTLADLGYTGATDANNYLHPTFTGNGLGGALTGAEVISNVTVNNEGHVTGFTKRSITAADVGAAIINDSTISSTATWSSSKIDSEISNALTGALIHKGGYNPSTNTPALSGATSGISKGWTYVITANGNFNGIPMAVGDMIVAEINDPTGVVDPNDAEQLQDWTIVNKNIPDIVDATETDIGIIRIATETEVLNGVLNNVAVTPATLVAFYEAVEASSGYAANVGDGVALTYDITHNLATKDLLVDVIRNSDGKTIMVPIERPTINTVRISVNTAVVTAGYRILVRKI